MQYKTLTQCTDYLYGLTNLEKNLRDDRAKACYTLDNIRQLLSLLKCRYPDLLTNKKVIHIAGTKGKGSTAFLTSSLVMTKYRTATFVSPHLIKPNERLLSGLVPISDEEFVRLTNEVAEVVDSQPTDSRVIPTTFECFYLMFLLMAYHNNADVLVQETGLGGRLDATNVIDSDIAVITPIGYDHTELLGDTIEAIAGEKAGIIKTAGQNVVIAKQYYDIENVFVRQAENVGAVIHFASDETKLEYQYHDYGYDVQWGGSRMRLNTLGTHQIDNLSTALTVCRILDPSIMSYIKEETPLIMPNGRIEILRTTPPLIADTAHNRESVDTLVETLKRYYPDVKWLVLSSMAADKDYQYFYHRLSEIADKFIITSLSSSKVSNPKIIADYAAQLCQTDFIPDTESAIRLAISQNIPLLVTGSFYLTGPVIEFIIHNS
ncbi:MAG: hypothetical protein II707_07155 [Spirochaetales bacterium]|nr:hypothetical protein [Spirochaetales bacterium]